jgi:Ca-activated chloride channel family protein
MIPLGRPAIAIILSALLLLGIGPSANARPENAEKTLSPYFLVKSDDPETDQLPLKSTAAEVAIAGVIADVVVTQIYENEGNRPLEAIYVFPASTRAAVHGMKMTIGERTIVAEIREREQARQEYEAAKEAGKSASLLEQQRPNVFQMNVANILPGDTIRVELRYTELLVPTDGVYEFVYPTVVGPRYSELPETEAPQEEAWVRNPYLREGEPPPYKFDFRATLSAGLPIAGVTSPSHEMDIAFAGPARVEARLTAEDKGEGGNRDVILKYRLSGGQIETGLLLYEGETEKFFLMMMQPPQRVEADSIPPREYVFIVDVSGSMRGFPLDTAKTLLRDLIGNLRPTDRFNVLLFAGGSQIFEKRSVTATEANIGRAISFIDNQQGGGGTQILPAMRRALNLPAEGTVSRSMVVVTDGYVRVETEAFDLIRNNLGEANLFAFGIGSSVNRFLIEGMARVGMGEPFVVTKPAEAA